MRVDLLVLTSCCAHDAVTACTLTVFGDVDGAADANKTDVVE
jgi:hypothetical protein